MFLELNGVKSSRASDDDVYDLVIWIAANNPDLDEITDPTSARDEASGVVLWSHPGSPVYDDVWAVGDDAVFVVDAGQRGGTTRLVAYDLMSGGVRWQVAPFDPGGWPWLVDGTNPVSIWTNVSVRSTRDGSISWTTDYPPNSPAMTGVRVNSDTVFVAFSDVASDGD